MTFWRRFLGGRRAAAPSTPEIDAWRQAAHTAADEGSTDSVDALLAQLTTLAHQPDDLEIEIERLEGRRLVLSFEEQVAASGLPIVETQHKIAAPDVCHAIFAVVLADAAADQPGTLLLTNRRLVFAGGRGITAGWGTINRAVRREREVLLDIGGRAVRIRCNTFGDARVVETLIQILTSSRPSVP